MDGKSQLLADKALAAWWVSVVHDPKFAQVCVCLRAEMAETSPSWEQLKGGNLLLDTMKTITDNEPTGGEIPTPGLIHGNPKPEKKE